jgi:CopG family transcriptional regulator, nickel-responsive regulator
MGRVVRFGVSLDADLLGKFDAHNRGRGYDNRSEAIRDLVRECLVEDEWKKGSGVKHGKLLVTTTGKKLA